MAAIDDHDEISVKTHQAVSQSDRSGIAWRALASEQPNYRLVIVHNQLSGALWRFLSKELAAAGN